MMIGYILPLSIVFGLLSYSLIAKWYVMPYLAALPRADALTPLLLLHSFRYIGMAFLISGVTSEVLDTRFAIPAANGDLLAALLALMAIMALRLRWAMAIPLVWIFNIEGFLDLINAVYQGFRHVPGGHFGATYFIPAMIVPALLVTHMMIFILLSRRQVSV
ncbi:MAG: hypothetical protein V3T60_01995 [Candidatus Binatia bacterium]